ncbi:MAG: outer membrane beta-barrel protein [Sphingobacteriaceae bacterium]
MKKIIALMLCLIIGENVFSQNDTVWVNGVPKVNHRKVGSEVNSSASPLVKDDYLFEVAYGYPFMPIREEAYFGLNSNIRTAKMIKNSNYLCLRSDYQLNEEYSVGLEFTYAQATYEYYRSYSSAFTGTSTITYKDSLFTAKATKIRFLVKMAYHFNISEKLDIYGTGGFGFKQFNLSTRDHYYTSTTNNDIIPVAVRLSVGGRFFLTDNWAICAEGGIGGPLMQIGLSLKMH